MFLSMPASSAAAGAALSAGAGAAAAAAMASLTGLGSILRRFDAPAKIVERIKMKSEFFLLLLVTSVLLPLFLNCCYC
jgi:hypothetical protein